MESYEKAKVDTQTALDHIRILGEIRSVPRL